MIPDGDLLRSRVLTALAPALSDVLDRRLDGYALLSSRDSLLGTDDESGVVTFEAGVPVLAYHSGTDRGGPAALDDIRRSAREEALDRADEWGFADAIGE